MLRHVNLTSISGLLNSRDGLTGEEALKRLAIYGGNHIVEDQESIWRELMGESIKDPMLWFLLVIGAAFWLTGESKEALVMFLAIVPLFGMDAVLHFRTRASTRGLKGRLSPQAQVWRDGREQTVSALEIVPGDLMLVKSGEFLAADGLWVEAESLQIDESTLTGESVPVAKLVPAFPSDTTKEFLFGSEGMGFAGTRCLAGRGRMRVVGTGARSAYGEIVRLAASSLQERTPLQKAIARLVRDLILASGGFCLLLAGVRLYQGYGWLNALLSAGTLAVAAIPEEFPMVFTFFLGVGVYRLAQLKALVRRAVSVENIGRVTHVCADKTGTMTEGRLALVDLLPAANLSVDRLREFARWSAERGSTDPVDQALSNDASANAVERIVDYPFTEQRKSSAAWVKADGRLYYVIKGAPEVVARRCDLTEAERTSVDATLRKCGAGGHKVLAVAYGENGKELVEPEGGLSFAGLMVFADPPRPEVADAIADCERLGVRVIMVTGDHPETARAIAIKIGLGGADPKVVSAEELPNRFSAEWLKQHPKSLADIDVLARCTPAQKLVVVQALQARGHLVAVTGDGVNDVPALRAADVGVAMGERGVQSAREVASIVLLDDNFRTLANAIVEGGQLFTNLRSSFDYLMAVHFPLVLTAAFIPLFGYPVVYMPAHIVWLELIIHPIAVLAFQGRAGVRDGRKIRKQARRSSFFTARDWWRIAVTGAISTTFVMASYVGSLGEGYEVDHARAMALTTLIGINLATMWAYQERLSKVAIVLTLGILLSLFTLAGPPSVAATLHLKPLHLEDWLLVVAFTVGFGLLQHVWRKREQTR